jgi:signal transduction histidine kinase
MEGSIGLACLLVLAASLPVAFFMSRHIVVPIQKLAAAAQALAQGNLSHRVAIQRRDELGSLVEAFNTMAHTVESQQAAITRINAGLEEKVRTRTAELEALNTRLKAEMAEKEDFLRTVSHDLNAPLRNISGMATMLMAKYREKLEADAIQRLERIQKNVEVECDLLNELLELSRIKSQREKIEAVDLSTLATQVREQFTGDLESRGIELQVGKLPVIQGEKARLRQVFQNLVDNAIKFMRPGTPRQIRVGSELRGNDVILYVADTGMGISPDDMPQLFHVFRRARSAAIAKIPGKGIGLASVKSIVETYGGRVWAQSTPGVGTTFFMSIPREHFPHLAPQEIAA